MIKDKDKIANLYEQIIEEQMTPLAVAGGDGTKPGDLPADAASTTETQTGTGAENAKDVKAPEEAEEKLSPVKKDKGTTKTATKKEVTAIKDSVEPKKSFMDLFNQVVVTEEDGAIDGEGYDDDAGDFPVPEEEVPVEGEGELSEGEIYSQLSDLFSQLASIKGGDMGMEDEMDGEMDGEMGPDMSEEIPGGESVRARGRAIEEMKSEPEPKELVANSSERQLPTSLAGKGVKKPGSKKAATKGNDKKRTGELEDGPEGFKHDKSKFKVDGSGPVHGAANASFLES